jgi:hypothetical protein
MPGNFQRFFLGSLKKSLFTKRIFITLEFRFFYSVNQSYLSQSPFKPCSLIVVNFDCQKAIAQCPLPFSEYIVIKKMDSVSMLYFWKGKLEENNADSVKTISFENFIPKLLIVGLEVQVSCKAHDKIANSIK